MTMAYRTVKEQIVTLLGNSAAGRFRVIGYRGQSQASSEIKNSDRSVQVYYSDGQFPKSAGGRIGRKIHDITIELDLSASASAKGDLSALNDESATPAEKAIAISTIKEASEEADEKIDELIEYVYQILMDARNEGLQFEKGFISNRWIDRIQKDTLLEHGALVVKTANLKYTCRVNEVVLGDVGNIPATVIIDSEFEGDVPSSGVKVENENI